MEGNLGNQASIPGFITGRKEAVPKRWGLGPKIKKEVGYDKEDPGDFPFFFLHCMWDKSTAVNILA